MNTGDARFIKQVNRKILIEEIIKNVSISRSDLARKTGLNKATVSAQVNDFLQERIVIEKTGGESINRGRKPILLEINDQAGYSIGIDIDELNLNIVFCDLKGHLFHQCKLPLESDDFDHVMDQLTDKISSYIEQLNQQYTPIGLIGIGVGIHGIVNNNDEIVYTPKQQWSNIHIKERLENVFNTDIYVDNNANLCVFAEQVYEEHLPDLFCITLYSGIGLGMIHDHNIYRGFQGFAGEIGHMIVEPHGKTCTCGNTGCWELYASEKTLKAILSEHYPSLPPQERIKKLLEDENGKHILDQYLDYLALGLNNVINIFNPEKIIFNGAMINKHPHFIETLQKKLQSKFNNYLEIRASQLGETACALGGAALALKNFFDINIINYVNYQYFQTQEMSM